MIEPPLPDLQHRLDTAVRLTIHEGGRVLDVETLHERRVTVYRAVAHAFLFKARHWERSAEDVAELLRQRAHRAVVLTGPGIGTLAKQAGVQRARGRERNNINRALVRLYTAMDGEEPSIVLATLARFLREHGPQIGLPRDKAIERIETLDAIQRAWGPPCALIPPEQYGLPP